MASDFGLLEFDEQAISDVSKTGAKADSAKAGKTTANIETGEASNPAGSESAPHVEPQASAPESRVIVTPPGSSAAEPQPEEPPTDSAAAPNADTNEAAAA